MHVYVYAYFPRLSNTCTRMCVWLDKYSFNCQMTPTKTKTHTFHLKYMFPRNVMFGISWLLQSSLALQVFSLSLDEVIDVMYIRCNILHLYILLTISFTSRNTNSFVSSCLHDICYQLPLYTSHHDIQITLKNILSHVPWHGSCDSHLICLPTAVINKYYMGGISVEMFHVSCSCPYHQICVSKYTSENHFWNMKHFRLQQRFD